MWTVVQIFFLLFFASGAHAACNIVNGVAYGDCGSVTINTGKVPFMTIDNYGSLSGISEGAHVLDSGTLTVSGVADRVVVEPGGSVQVSGIVSRLEVGGTAYVSGHVNTIVLRDGSKITVEGVVGTIFGRGFATFISGSVVSGRPTPSTFDRFYTH